MQTNASNFNYLKYTSIEELTSEDKELYQAACEATHISYAPYSKLNVGAALLIDNGEIIAGSNQENESYPSGACAERVALFSAVNKPNFRERKIKTIAIAARRTGDNNFIEISPCGECRQVLCEYAKGNDLLLKIIMTGPENSILIIEDVSFLLPFVFNNPRSSSV